jgi:hypothetical protein
MRSLVFTGVVQAGSFIAASKALGIPKSTVSRKIAALEERLDTRTCAPTALSACFARGKLRQRRSTWSTRARGTFRPR